MGKTLITDFYTYRHRYLIGYAVVLVAFVLLLLFAGLYVPGGLSNGEIRTVTKTAGVTLSDPSTLAVTNMPYLLMQKLSLFTLGPSNFSIKLPSLIAAFVTGVGAVLLLRRWFRPNIAVLSSIIMITTGQFLFVAQSGTASIFYIMWAVWLLLAASMITSSERHKRFWKVLFFILIPLSLYTPLSIYLIIAIISAALLHPHVRSVLKRMSLQHLLGLLFISLVVISPLAYLIYLRPQLAAELLGVPATWPPDLLANARSILQQYFNFINPQSGALMTPVLGLGSIALIIIGIWQLYKTSYTARSYTLTAWAILLIPVLLINPIYTSIAFVPFLLLLASGLSYLLRAWYRMFPRNPYARFAGLVPLVILVAGLVFSGVERHMYGYHYDPETATSFSRDLTLFNYRVKNENTTLLVTAGEKPFYDAVAKYEKGKKLSIVTTAPATGQFAATRDAHSSVTNGTIAHIVATGYSDAGDRFYIYK